MQQCTNEIVFGFAYYMFGFVFLIVAVVGMLLECIFHYKSKSVYPFNSVTTKGTKERGGRGRFNDDAGLGFMSGSTVLGLVGHRYRSNRYIYSFQPKM